MRLEDVGDIIEQYYDEQRERQAIDRMIAWCAANAGMIKAKRPSDLWHIEGIDEEKETAEQIREKLIAKAKAHKEFLGK